MTCGLYLWIGNVWLSNKTRNGPISFELNVLNVCYKSKILKINIIFFYHRVNIATGDETEDIDSN